MSRKVRYAADAGKMKCNHEYYYLHQGSYVFTCACLFVCLSVNTITNKTTDQIFMKFLWNGWT